MNKRQRFALLHPLDSAGAPPSILAAYRLDRQLPSGVLLRTILAVDR
jgi:hypothetical protein